MYSAPLQQLLQLVNTIAGLLTPVLWFWLNVLEAFVFN
jgi:hypothetical protein